MTTEVVKKIVIALLLVLLAAGTVFLIVHGYEAWRGHVLAEGDTAGAARVQGLWDKDKQTRATVLASAVDAARKQERESAAKAVEGERNARIRAEEESKQLQAAARRSAAAAGGVRDDIAALDRAAAGVGIPDAASCPGQFARQRDEATRARALFGACVAEYQLLAADAESDGAAVRLRLDTALSYIKATGAPGAEEVP